MYVEASFKAWFRLFAKYMLLTTQKVLTQILHRLHHVDDTTSYILDKIIRLLIDGGTAVDAVGRQVKSIF